MQTEFYGFEPPPDGDTSTAGSPSSAADILRALIEDVTGFNLDDEIDLRCNQAAGGGEANIILDENPLDIDLKPREVFTLWPVVNEDGEQPVTLYEQSGSRDIWIADGISTGDAGPNGRSVPVHYDVHVTARVLGINKFNDDWIASIKFEAEGEFSA